MPAPRSLSRLRDLELAAADDHSRVTQARERLFAAIVTEYNSGTRTRPAGQHARRRSPTHRGRQRRGLRRPGRHHPQPGRRPRSRSPTAACSAWWPVPGSPWSKAHSTTPQTRRITARRSPPRSTGTAARRSSAFIWPTPPAEQRTFRPARDTSRHDNNRLPHPELRSRGSRSPSSSAADPRTAPGPSQPARRTRSTGSARSPARSASQPSWSPTSRTGPASARCRSTG